MTSKRTPLQRLGRWLAKPVVDYINWVKPAIMPMPDPPGTQYLLKGKPMWKIISDAKAGARLYVGTWRDREATVAKFEEMQRAFEEREAKREYEEAVREAELEMANVAAEEAKTAQDERKPSSDETLTRQDLEAFVQGTRGATQTLIQTVRDEIKSDTPTTMQPDADNEALRLVRETVRRGKTNAQFLLDTAKEGITEISQAQPEKPESGETQSGPAADGKQDPDRLLSPNDAYRIRSVAESGLSRTRKALEVLRDGLMEFSVGYQEGRAMEEKRLQAGQSPLPRSVHKFLDEAKAFAPSSEPPQPAPSPADGKEAADRSAPTASRGSAGLVEEETPRPAAGLSSETELPRSPADGASGRGGP